MGEKTTYVDKKMVEQKYNKQDFVTKDKSISLQLGRLYNFIEQ